MSQKFNATIKLDVRDSNANWPLYELTKAPKRTPNFLIIVDEADENNVRPVDDDSPMELLTPKPPVSAPPKDTYVYYPGTSPVPDGVAVNARGRSYKILADVEIKDTFCSGVIFAHGSRFGGHTLFIKDQKLYYVYNFLGIKPEQKFVSTALQPGKYTLGMEFIRERAGQYGESIGKTKLYVGQKVVAEGPMKTQPDKFTLSGDGLCIGRDSGDSVSQEYLGPGDFKGGIILAVAVSVGKQQYADRARGC